MKNIESRVAFLKGEMILESAVNKGVSVVLTFKMRDAIKIILVDDEVLLEKESPSCWDAKLILILFLKPQMGRI
jgi:hypothetical protein